VLCAPWAGRHKDGGKCGHSSWCVGLHWWAGSCLLVLLTHIQMFAFFLFPITFSFLFLRAMILIFFLKRYQNETAKNWSYMNAFLHAATNLADNGKNMAKTLTAPHQHHHVRILFGSIHVWCDYCMGCVCHVRICLVRLLYGVSCSVARSTDPVTQSRYRYCD
jgi:hypothetical protein